MVAVGTFDGVHLGHRKLLRTVREEAARRGIASVGVTFRQQPRSVVRPGVPFSYLCDFDERMAILGSLGLDAVAPLDFDDSVRFLSAAQFLGCLRSVLNMQVLVLGPGARQGHDQVDAPGLAALGRELGFEVLSLGPAVLNGQPVSSTAIRAALADGKVEDAARLLGRRFALTGTVLPGDRRGRELGFPTANLGPFAHATVPRDGIYATWAHLSGANGHAERHMAATSIGVRPTFGQDNERRVEAYILDFGRDIYGMTLRLEFVRRLRDEAAYTGPGLLIEQIRRDVEQTREILTKVASEEMK